MLNKSPLVDSYLVPNYWSCCNGDAEEKLDSLIECEIHEGKLSIASELPECIHAMGAIRKSTGKYRPITDCSCPAGVSINNHMCDILSEFSFIRLEDILPSIEYGSFLSVLDLQAAYRSVAIHPSDRKYFGLAWHDKEGNPIILQDNFLSFGICTAPAIFNSITDSITHMLKEDTINCWKYLELSVGSLEPRM